MLHLFQIGYPHVASQDLSQKHPIGPQIAVLSRSACSLKNYPDKLYYTHFLHLINGLLVIFAISNIDRSDNNLK